MQTTISSPFFGRTLKKEPKHHQILGYVHFWKWQFHLIHQYACVSLLLIYGLDHVQVNFSWKWIVGKNLGWSANCSLSQPKFFPTIHFQSTIHFQLQFTCTWSGPKFSRFYKKFRRFIHSKKLSLSSFIFMWISIHLLAHLLDLKETFEKKESKAKIHKLTSLFRNKSFILDEMFQNLL